MNPFRVIAQRLPPRQYDFEVVDHEPQEYEDTQTPIGADAKELMRWWAANPHVDDSETLRDIKLAVDPYDRWDVDAAMVTLAHHGYFKFTFQKKGQRLLIYTRTDLEYKL